VQDERGRKRIKKCRNYNKTILATNDYGYQKDSAGFSLPNDNPSSTPGHHDNKKCDCKNNNGRKNKHMTEGERELQRDFLRRHSNYRSKNCKLISFSFVNFEGWIKIKLKLQLISFM